MNAEPSQKITATHLKRSAFLYVRQSTPRQVLEHTESTARQYALRQRAVRLGWQEEQVIVIDSDLGRSGASAAGLKGTMSEAELHLIRARMRGGLLNKAKRGELTTALPCAFVYDDQHRVVLDPDQQIQRAIRCVFETFRLVGSAFAVAKTFRQEDSSFLT